MALTGLQMLEKARMYCDDLVEPFAVQNSHFYDFLTEAERELAVAGKLLRKVDTYAVAENARWLELNTEPEVLELRTAFLIDGDRRYPLALVGTMDNGYAFSGESDYGMIFSSDNLTPGRPTRLVFGQISNSVELSPPANKAYTIEVTVVVYPEDPITAATTEPTIPDRHAMAIPIGCALRVVELEPFFDENSRKVQTLSAAWARALGRAASEAAVINRDVFSVKFTSDYW